ncbi:SAM-dependent methyltransferase [Amycolatopsis pigmentata]|uniref:SAM-dependent methyltransferase n=1 Tax=Amycolatopsis pigmentata TaxID=450801 RepID=A0ABW5G519_9PSEU
MVPPDHAPPSPDEPDLDRPSVARVYDWYLGGRFNYAVDRVFGQRAVQRFPLIKPLAHANRTFLGRVVAEALDAGIVQFLDLGSGIPTVGNVHEAVAAHTDGSYGRVVYVDHEPVAAAHAETILAEQGCLDWAGIVRSDFRDPIAVLEHPTTQRLLDFTKPICVLFVSVLHFVGAETNIERMLATYVDPLPTGSWLALSHISNDDVDDEGAAQIARLAGAYRQESQNPAYLRKRDEIQPWFGPLSLLEPGLVHLSEWRPTPSASPYEASAGRFMWCGVGEKRDDQ